MKLVKIKILVALLIFLYVGWNQFLIVIPISALLVIELLNELKRDGIRSSLFKPNFYVTSLGIIFFLGFISLLWTPNLSEGLYELGVLLFLIINSILIFFFVKKYELFNLVIYSILAICFLNYTAALNIHLFDFMLFNSDTRGGLDGVVMGWGWGGRFSGTMENPNILAIIVLFSIFLSLFNLSYQELPWKAKLCHLLNIFLGSYTIILTQSRKGMVFSVLLILLFLFFNASIKRILAAGVATIILVLILSSIQIVEERVTLASERLSRIVNTIEGTDNESSTSQRLSFISEGIEDFTKNPFFGYGINSFRHYYGKYSHNNFIELLFGLGILAPLIYYRIHLAILWKSFVDRRGRGIIAFVIVVFFMDIGFVSYDNKVNMLILTLLALLVDQLRARVPVKDIKT